MPRYHIHFITCSTDETKPNRHTRQVDVSVPIEYDSDIEAVQVWAAKEVGATSAALIWWQELKGEQRPDSN